MNFLKTFRKVEGLTQKELAKKLGISRTFLSELENKKKVMSIEVLVKLCDETGYNSCFFLCDMFEKKFPLCSLCNCKELKGMPLNKKVEKFIENREKVKRNIKLVRIALDNNQDNMPM